MDDFRNEYEEDKNIIVERNSAIEDTLYDEDKVTYDENEMVVTKEKNKKNRKQNKFSFKKLTKKQKIIFIVSISLIIIVIIFILVYFLVIKNGKKDAEEKEKPVIVEKDNYIYNNGVLKFLSDDEKVIGEYTCENKSEDKCYVAYLTNENKTDLPLYLDEEENLLNRRSWIYEESFVFVQDGEDIILYNINSKKNEGKYKTIKVGLTSDNIVACTDENGKYSLLRLVSKPENILNDTYDYIDIYSSDDTFIVKEETSYYLVKNGSKVSKDFKDAITAFNEKFIVVNNNLYDYNGNKVLQDTYDYIKVTIDYVFAFDGKKLTVYDNKLNKLNESEIKIKSNDYITKYIFDKDNNLKETKKAFDYSKEGTNLVIKYDDKTVTINTLEGILNTSYDYVSYYNGSLYFYLDEDKTNLIGSYTCKKKNTVTSKTVELTDCFVSKNSNIISEESGYIPIINSSYVFIKDENNGKQVINLYDLKNSKIITEYNMVDAGVSSDKISTITSLNSLVICQNTSLGYGAITFSNSGPSGVISFNDNKSDENSTGKTLKISLLKDYLYVQRENANLLYDKIGNEIARSKFDIIDYHSNYILVKNNDKYLVYLKGVIISNEGKYIKFYDNYFAQIDNDNKLNIYSYIDGKKPILSGSLQINNKDFSSSFEINETENSYVISLISSDNKKEIHTFDKTSGKEIIGDENEG